MRQRKIGNGPIILGKKGEGKLEENWIFSIGWTVGVKNEEVKLNGASPHVIFVCGARGSGKSYTLGVLAEEIDRKGPDIAVVIVDPIGVFWSMKHPNQEEEEVELLDDMGMNPRGMENLQVYVPIGYRSEIPGRTFDTDFSFRPSGLGVEDWCLTFGIDRYGPQGLLLERVTKKVRSGYTRRFGDKMEGGSRDVPPTEDFSINDLLKCINHDREILSKEKGFKTSTRRALTSRLEAAKDWGIFGEEKKISDLIKPGRISVFDISFLPENIGALVLGILARKILMARKTAVREEAVRDLEGEKSERFGPIPPTWLMVDEAHRFAPSSGKTAASDPLVEYVKQGRRPGLSAVFSTQQPSALNSKILSQLDILLSHRLTFEGDIREVRKRMPTSIPEDLKNPDSLKKLPEGTALTADKETNRAFLASIRPRFSQHEGRERITKSAGIGRFRNLDQKIESPEKLTDSDMSYSHEEEEALIVTHQISMDEALAIAQSERKRMFGFLWPSEDVRRITLHYYPIWSALIDYYPKNGEPRNLRVLMDGLTSELFQRTGERLERTYGVRTLSSLKTSERALLSEVLRDNPLDYSILENSVKKSSKIKRNIGRLVDKGLITVYEMEGRRLIGLEEGIRIPPTLSEETLLAAEEVPEYEAQMISSEKKIDRVVSEKKLLKILEFFGKIEVVELELFYYPYWIAKLTEDGRTRIVAIGASGQRDKYAERMVRGRVE